jgi:hypothetical protein
MKYSYLALALLCSGCSLVDLNELAKEPPQKKRYILVVKMPGRGFAPVAEAPVLLVEEAHVLAPYNGRPFVTRVGGHEFVQDYYHEFLVSPGQMFSQITRTWLRTQGVFPQVVDTASPLAADAVLKIDLTKLLGDYSVEGKPVARVAIQASLLSSAGGEERPKIEFQKNYEAESRLPDQEPATLVVGWSLAIPEILGKLSADLSAFGRARK